jgi:uncharacterized protein YegP (UPF0339 family)
MATAKKKVHAATSPALAKAASLEFLIYQDNGGDYRWEIVDRSGKSLVQSRSFASPDDAEGAARYLYEGAHSARFELQVAKERQTGAM